MLKSLRIAIPASLTDDSATQQAYRACEQALLAQANGTAPCKRWRESPAAVKRRAPRAAAKRPPAREEQ